MFIGKWKLPIWHFSEKQLRVIQSFCVCDGFTENQNWKRVCKWIGSVFSFSTSFELIVPNLYALLYVVLKVRKYFESHVQPARGMNVFKNCLGQKLYKLYMSISSISDEVRATMCCFLPKASYHVISVTKLEYLRSFKYVIFLLRLVTNPCLLSFYSIRLSQFSVNTLPFSVCSSD